MRLATKNARPFRVNGASGSNCTLPIMIMDQKSPKNLPEENAISEEKPSLA
jgi:hypothetical protein